MTKGAKCIRVTAKCLDVKQLAEELMARNGLVGWEFSFNENKRRAGVCYYPIFGTPGRIELSVHFIERNGPEVVRDTLLHEIAHGLVGFEHGHDESWKAKCREIGARPERCYGDDVDMPKGQWKATCPHCQQSYYRHRRPRVLVGWHCRSCGPTLGTMSWTGDHR